MTNNKSGSTWRPTNSTNIVNAKLLSANQNTVLLMNIHDVIQIYIIVMDRLYCYTSYKYNFNAISSPSLSIWFNLCTWSTLHPNKDELICKCDPLQLSKQYIFNIIYKIPWTLVHLNNVLDEGKSKSKIKKFPKFSNNITLVVVLITFRFEMVNQNLCILVKNP